MITLVLGGARSGKSSCAMKLAEQATSEGQGLNLHYVATAIPFDDEMSQRILHHKTHRGAEWRNHESPYELVKLLRQFNADDVVLVDCLILWLNNTVFALGEMVEDLTVDQYVNELIASLKETKAKVILVSNEVGMSTIPEGELSELFASLAGTMNQRVANIASEVILVAAGIPLAIKGH